MILTIKLPSKQAKNILKTVLKIAVTILCLGYISSKIDLSKAASMVVGASPFWIGLGVVMFLISKFFSAIRLNIYFANIGVQVSLFQNSKLYLLGMFYNLFLPGSIGGDAYKVVRLHKTHATGYKPLSAAILLDRLSGLLALCVLLCLCWLAMEHSSPISLGMIGFLVLCLPAYYLLMRLFFPVFLPGYWSTFLWSMVVQLFQIAALWCILQSLDIATGYLQYIIIFLASSVIAVLPFTIGGLGARELVFVWGAQYFFLPDTISVTASALFYIATVISCSFGLPFVFIDPLQTGNQNTANA